MGVVEGVGVGCDEWCGYFGTSRANDHFVAFRIVQQDLDKRFGLLSCS